MPESTSRRELALVTGASSGIGAEIARVLAARGIELVITARREERLATLRTDLEQAHGISVTPIVADLDTPDGARRLFDETVHRRLDVTILINNAGFGLYGLVAGQSEEQIASLLQVNVSATTMLARLFGESMCSRGHGYILNVSSFAALQPIPRYTIYSGAKAYLLAFSLGLRHEMRPHGVKVSVVCPGFTSTEFHAVAEHRKTSWIRMTTMPARQVARASVQGLLRGKAVIVPGWFYKLNAQLVRVMPPTWGAAISAAVVKS
ncbi:MAG: SDR family oxidoreductase [Pirellulales bacterium]